MRGSVWVVACAIGLGAGCAGGSGSGSTSLVPDAGTARDGGGSDGGLGGRLTLHVGPVLDPPSALYDQAHGLSNEVVDASRDAAGNLWAVSGSRLFVLRAGLGAFESFGPGDGLKDDELLSVSGGVADVAWVGYRGLGDDNADPLWWRETGGAQKVELSGADIRTTTYQLSSGPGVFPQYPEGRFKLRSCWRAYAVKSGPLAGEAWFGCNHGVAMVGPRFGVEEHHHPGVCIVMGDPTTCTTKTGDVPAVAFTPDGDRWFGGTYGVMLLDYSDGNGNTQFWGPEPVRNESLFANPVRPNAHGSEDVSGLAVAADGTLWAGSLHSGLVHRLADGTVHGYRTDDGLPSNAVEDVAMDADGGLWIAFSEHGIWRLDTATGELRRASGLPSGLGRRVVFEETALGPAVVAVVRGGVAVYER